MIVHARRYEMVPQAHQLQLQSENKTLSNKVKHLEASSFGVRHCQCTLEARLDSQEMLQQMQQQFEEHVPARYSNSTVAASLRSDPLHGVCFGRT